MAESRRVPAEARLLPADPDGRCEHRARQPLLRPCSNCWRIERAGRLAVIIDAADYFAAVKAAIRQARHSVLLIGWDFDLRIKLEPERASPDVPDDLGEFLKSIA